MAEMEDRRLSISEIRKDLGVSSYTVYKWIEKHEMPAHRVGAPAARLDIFQHYEMNDAFTFANRLQQYRPCKAFEVTFIKGKGAISR